MAVEHTKFTQQLTALLDGYGNQEALAADLGVHKSTVSRWARGITAPQRRHVEDVEALYSEVAGKRWFLSALNHTIEALESDDADPA